MRVSQIARRHARSSREVLDLLQTIGAPAKTASSRLPLLPLEQAAVEGVLGQHICAVNRIVERTHMGPEFTWTEGYCDCGVLVSIEGDQPPSMSPVLVGTMEVYEPIALAATRAIDPSNN